MPAQVRAEVFSLKDTIEIGLKNNWDIVLADIAKESSLYSLRSGRGDFDPSVSIGTEKSNSNAFTNSSNTTTDTDTDSYSVAISGKTPFGPSYSTSMNASKALTDTTITGIDPEESKTFTNTWKTTLTVPLLKGGWKTNARLSLDKAERVYLLNGLKLKKAQIEKTAEIINAYLDLSLASYSLTSKTRSLERAKETLEKAKIRIKAGSVAKIEEFSSELAVNNRELDVINATIDLETKRENLLDLLKLPLDQDFQAKEVVVPKESMELNYDNQLKQVTAKNIDLRLNLISIKNTHSDLAAAKLNRLPTLDLKGSFSLAGSDDETLSNAWKYTFDKNRTKSWTVGLTLTMPIGNRQPYYQMMSSINSLKTNELNNARTLVQVEQDLKKAIRNIESKEKQIGISELKRKNSELQMEAAKSRFSVGKISADKLLEFQDDYLNADIALQQAKYDFLKEIVTLDKLNGVAHAVE